MATYYALFAEQLSRPVVSVPYVDAFGTGKTKEIIIIIYGLARLVIYHGRKNECTVVIFCCPYKASRKFSKALYGTTGCTYSARVLPACEVSHTYRLRHRKGDVRIFIHEFQNFGKLTRSLRSFVRFPKF